MASAFQIRLAAHLVNQGGVIIYPTETIYGLGCSPYYSTAIRRINRLKQRKNKAGLILLASDIRQLEPLIEKKDFLKLTGVINTDKPTSWIVKAANNTPGWLMAEDGTIAVRITSHPVTKQLCQQAGSAIISTSANISGKKPAENALELAQNFGGRVDYILTTDISGTGQASTIKRLADLSTIR